MHTILAEKALGNEGHFEEALNGVVEVWAMLEALLDLPLPFTEDRRLAQALRPRHDSDSPELVPGSCRWTELQALYLNYLGKCYRLACTLSLDLGKPSGEVAEHVRRALRCLRLASAGMPLLPYPYGHRLHLAREVRFPMTDREAIVRDVAADLEHLDANDQTARTLISRLRREFPEVAD